MMPNRRLGSGRYLYPIREMQEVDMSPRQATATSTPLRSDYEDFMDVETESDDEDFHGTDEPVDMLLFASIETYVLSVRPSEMASSSCIGTPTPYSHMMFYPGPLGSASTPERRIGDDTSTNIRSEDQDMHILSDDQEDNDISLNSTLSSLSRDLSTRSESRSDFSPLPSRRCLKRKTFTSRKDLLTSEPTQARRSLRSVPRMAPPSNIAILVAIRVIRYAHCIRNIHEKDMCCLNCGLFPFCPVTGQCGHTRCTKCILDKSICPCGDDSADPLYVNVLIRDLIEKTASKEQCSSGASNNSVTTGENSAAGVSTDTKGIPNQPPTSGHVLARESYSSRLKHKRQRACCLESTPMSPVARYNHALDLLRSGKHWEAAPHLALAAASSHQIFKPARMLLAKIIAILSKNRNARALARQLNHMVRHLSSTAWIKSEDVECVLCCDTFTNPVTTPCGHMFCRICLERTMDYNKRCPLCLRPLDEFNLNETRNTVLVQAALRSINAVNVPPPVEPDLIPIFVCTVAYPSVPCPLFIFDPRYWLMIRRVLESGSRKFGIVASDRGQYADYGTILEVRDCVHLEDGRSILSTIGLSRFKVIERGVRDGCEVARILPITDVPPVDVMEVWDLKLLAKQILFKTVLWLGRLNRNVVEDIVAAFGKLPFGSDEEWWQSTDGPSWIWWLVAVLPLRSEIKILILSTDCLLKRMLAVDRTLDAVDRVTLTTTNASECYAQNRSTTNQAMQRGQGTSS